MGAVRTVRAAGAKLIAEIGATDGKIRSAVHTIRSDMHACSRSRGEYSVTGVFTKRSYGVSRRFMNGTHCSGCYGAVGVVAHLGILTNDLLPSY